MGRAHPSLAALLAVALEQAEAPFRTQVMSHLPACGGCRQRFRELSCDLAELTLALEPSPLPAMLREGILQAAGEIHRLFDAAKPLARVLRISRRHAHGILLRLDAPRYWHHTPAGWQLRVPESPLSHAHVVRLQAGEVLRLRERGQVATRCGVRLLLVLQGTAHDEAGQPFCAPNHVGGRILTAPRPRGALVVQPGADFLGVMAGAVAAPKLRSGRAQALPREPARSRSLH